jgi:hypothetical protein
MLYTAGMMKTKPNIPGEIFLGEREYSWRADWRVNGWLFVATLISGFADIIFHHATSQLPLAARVGIQVAEFCALALWARSLTRWISGMDEMHRRITGSAVLFAASATFFVLMLWHRLDAVGFFNAMFGMPKSGSSWDICTVCHGFLLMTLFYFAGQTVFSRRYR